VRIETLVRGESERTALYWTVAWGQLEESFLVSNLEKVQD